MQSLSNRSAKSARTTAGVPGDSEWEPPFDDTDDYSLPDIDLGRDLKPRTRNLLFGRPGQGKSRQAIKLAKAGWCVLFACASNKQAEEQHGNCTHPDKQLIRSKSYKLERQHGVKATTKPKSNPWEPPDIDERKTFRGMVKARIAPNEKVAEEMWRNLGGDEPDCRAGTIIYMTHARAHILGMKRQFVLPFGSSRKWRELVERTVLIVDDVGVQTVTQYARVEGEVQKWAALKKAQGENVETIIMGDGTEYAVRQDDAQIHAGFQACAVVFTTLNS